MDKAESTMLIPEVARVLRISRTKAYEMARSGEIPVVKVGRSLRVPTALFEEWLNKKPV